MNPRTSFVGLVVLLSWIEPAVAEAQESPFVEESIYRLLDNEISGDRAKDNLAVFTRYHRASGSEGFHKAAELITKIAAEYGLEGARIIRQESLSPSWSPGPSELWMIQPDEIKLADKA